MQKVLWSLYLKNVKIKGVEVMVVDVIVIEHNTNTYIKTLERILRAS